MIMEIPELEKTFVLYRDSKRVTLKDVDMTVDKIGTIFQVNANTLYITDDANTAIFPESSGNFLYINLSHRGHYEVHGDPIHAQSVGGQHGAQPAVPFSFMRRASAPASTGVSQPGTSRQSRPNMFPAKDFQRAVHIGEVMSGKITSSRTVVIRFTESEATVDHITAKVKEALGCEDSLTLTDSQGNEIIDSHATRSSNYWKQNSRKVYALYNEEFLEWRSGRKNKTRRSEETCNLNGVIEKIDDLKHAAESLPDITEAIRVLSDIAKRGAQEATLTLARDSLNCLVCKGLLSEPMASTCCNSLVGCKKCVTQWLLTSTHCLKCRVGDFQQNVHELKGLGDVLGLFSN